MGIQRYIFHGKTTSVTEHEQGPWVHVNDHEAEVEQLKACWKAEEARTAEALEHLVEVVGQACAKYSPQYSSDLDSMATSAYADAMLYLARIGKIELDREHVGRRMIGRWKEN